MSEKRQLSYTILSTSGDDAEVRIVVNGEESTQTIAIPRDSDINAFLVAYVTAYADGLSQPQDRSVEIGKTVTL